MLTGSHGDYQWFETERELGEVIALCPEILKGKYSAVTSLDSGPFRLSVEDRLLGWTDAGEIAYGPGGASIPIAGYDEWYIFEERPSPLGSIRRDNVFDAGIAKASVFTFVNFLGFRFSSAAMEGVSELFWKQIAWLQPESYLADGAGPALFVTRNAALFELVTKRF